MKSRSFSEKALPQYNTVSGTLRTSDPLVVHSPPLMWVEALDLLFDSMRSDGVDLSRILAVWGWLNNMVRCIAMTRCLRLSRTCNLLGI